MHTPSLAAALLVAYQVATLPCADGHGMLINTSQPLGVDNAEAYSCTLCEEYVRHSRFCSQRNPEPRSMFAVACNLMHHVFDGVLPTDIPPATQTGEAQPHPWCLEHQFCAPFRPEAYTARSRGLRTAAGATQPDIRVTNVLGDRGHPSVRLSVVSVHDQHGTNNVMRPSSNVEFTYDQQFKLRWTQFHLQSTVLQVVPGETKTVNVQGVDVDLHLPVRGQGARGVVLADPCFDSRYVQCKFGEEFNTFQRTTEMINLLLGDPQGRNHFDFYAILGDNFYDRGGELSKLFMDHLSVRAKSKVLVTVPGNHDYWVCGNPYFQSPSDQFALGYLQFYAQDTIGLQSRNGDFMGSMEDPATKNRRDRTLDAANFFSFHEVGDIGFVGFSSANSFADLVPHLKRACTHFQQVPTKAVFLLGHWNRGGMGASRKSSAPAVHKSMKRIPECKPIMHKVRYLTGHVHCNVVLDHKLGYMVGAQGMAGCGQFGLPVIDTKQGHVEILYFEFASGETSDTVDRYEQVKDCFQEFGFDGCKHLAKVWFNGTLDDPATAMAVDM